MIRAIFALSVAACLGLTGCTESLIKRESRSLLDTVISFSDPKLCTLSQDTEILFRSFVENNSDVFHKEWIKPGKIPRHLRHLFGPIRLIKNDGAYIIRTSTSGTLWGLPLKSIDQYFPVGGDPGGFTFSFIAPTPMVERVLKEMGFPAKAGASISMGTPNVYDHTLTLVPDHIETAITHFDCGYS